MPARGAEAARRRVGEAGDHPADLDKHEVRKRGDGLVVDGAPRADGVQHGGARPRRRRQVPERPAVVPPVRRRDLVLQDAEDVEFVRVAHRLRHRAGARVEPFGQVAAVVEEDGVEDGLRGLGGGQPALRDDDVAGEDGVVGGIGVAEGPVAPQLLVAARVVQQRRREAGPHRGRVEALPLGDEPRVLDDLRRVEALELHHRRQGAVHAERVHIGVVPRRQVGQAVHAAPATTGFRRRP